MVTIHNIIRNIHIYSMLYTILLIHFHFIVVYLIIIAPARRAFNVDNIIDIL